MENATAWVDQVEKLIQEKHMLVHPFYQAWTRGHLSKSTLQEYAKEYYHHVKAFPTYLSSLHSRCKDPTIRKSLLSNLIDEEAGSPNHPELWREFALSLGIEPKELDQHLPRQETKELVTHFRDVCKKAELAAGIAALYSYESQIPSICTSKIEGLKKWYGLTNEATYRYFSVHESADIEHAREEREMLLALTKPENERAVLETVQKTLDRLWKFLSSFHLEVACA